MLAITRHPAISEYHDFHHGPDKFPKPDEVWRQLHHNPEAFRDQWVWVRASLLLLYLIRKDNEWQEFTLSDVMGFYISQAGDPDTAFDGLLTPWNDGMGRRSFIDPPAYLMNIFPGKYTVTDNFVYACLGVR